MTYRSIARTLKAGVALLALACALTAAAGAAEVDPQETRALHALFDREWEYSAQRFPEAATWRGDLRFNDRLTDNSQQAIAAHDARVRQVLAEARAVRRDRLGETDRVSLDLFVRDLADEAERQAFPGYRSLLVGANGGAQSDFAQFLRAVPVNSVEQAEQLLRRMARFPRLMDEEIAIMRKGKALNWVASRDVLDRALTQIDDQLPADPQAGPYFEPFNRLASSIAAAERERLRAAARAAIEQHVMPAMRKLRDFIAQEYLPAAPADGALHHYPDGRRVYEMLVRQRTTTSLTAAEVHAVGQRELARLRGEMEAIMRETGFTGDFAQFVAYLNTDPKFTASGPEALLTGYRDIAKRIDAELPRLFAELPRAPYGVRPMPAFEGPNAAEYYSEPALDGSRGGYFNANVLAWRTKRTWAMATLTAHEAVPGHHLQIARSVELRALPKFRRAGANYTAFVEGWAVYAETLGREIGLYDDPYSRFGHLQWQAMRAARLVVDTGIHHLGWSRQQAIDFLAERVGVERGFVTQEVDRYTSWPGQALGYMIGKLKIDELRDRAKARLGPRFDIRRFHNAVIDQGALPLDTLDTLINEWIAREASCRSFSCPSNALPGPSDRWP